MSGELTDALGQNSDLNLGGAGVALVDSILGDDLGLDFLGDHGEKLLSNVSYTLHPGHGAERTPHQRHDPEAQTAGACFDILPSTQAEVKHILQVSARLTERAQVWYDKSDKNP